MYLVISVIVILFIMWWCQPCAETFATAPELGAVYSERDFKGERIGMQMSEKKLFHKDTFRIWSCDATGSVIKVTAEGLPYMLHLRGGRINNLPAALGGLPAHENYTGIFNSGRNVMIELVPLDQAQAEVSQGRSNCINTLQYPAATCAEEFSQL